LTDDGKRQQIKEKTKQMDESTTTAKVPSQLKNEIARNSTIILHNERTGSIES
jgi:hypothetical protein